MQLTRAFHIKIVRKQGSIQRRLNGKRDQTKAREQKSTRTNASDSRSSQPLQRQPDIREVSRDPILPLLKRRRTAASDSTPKRTRSSPDLPVTRDATPQESAQKRRYLNEPEQTNITATSNTKPNKSEPVIRAATEKETAAKRSALTEPDDIEEMSEMDARFPPESSRVDTATPSSTRNSKDCVDAKEKQAQQANAAEARARNTLKRGI